MRNLFISLFSHHFFPSFFVVFFFCYWWNQCESKCSVLKQRQSADIDQICYSQLYPTKWCMVACTFVHSYMRLSFSINISSIFRYIFSCWGEITPKQIAVKKLFSLNSSTNCKQPSKYLIAIFLPSDKFNCKTWIEMNY